MKLSYILSGIIALSSVFASCELEYDAPPLNVPTYTGTAANISLLELKTKYASATAAKPDTITEDLVVKAYINSTDDGGNIYKTVYIQDSTAAFAFLVDQSGVGGTYRVGQEVYINLKGLVVAPYGGELQLGYPGAYLNRTPWVKFQEHVLKNNWPAASNISVVETADISSLNSNVAFNTFRVVKLTGVTFTEGGTKTYAEPSGYGSRELKDANGNTIVVRTSNYATFAKDTIPTGKGTVYGVLGRYNSGWQLLLRTANDVQDFTANNTTTTDTTTTDTTKTAEQAVIFTELFGTGTTVEKVNNFFPDISIYKGFTSGLTVTDPVMTGTYSNASVRSTSTLNPHVWFAANKDAQLHFSGITLPAEYTSYTLTYDITHNADATHDQNVIGVRAGSTDLTVPSLAVAAKNTFQTVTITGIAPGFTTLTFISTATTNTAGFRIDNVKLVGNK